MNKHKKGIHEHSSYPEIKSKIQQKNNKKHYAMNYLLITSGEVVNEDLET